MKHMLAMTILLALCGADARGATEVGTDAVLHDLKGLHALRIDLYRGIVNIRTARREDAWVQASLLDFDHYLAVGEKMVRSPVLQLASSSDMGVLSLEGPSSRELVLLEIELPPEMEIQVHVNHYGEVTARGLRSDAEIEIFQGAVTLAAHHAAASVSIIRNGTIRADLLDGGARRPSAFSSFEGRIELGLQDGFEPRLQLQSFDGTIENDLPPARAPQGPPIMVTTVKGSIHIHGIGPGKEQR